MIANRYAPVDNVLPSSDYRTLFRGLVAHVADATSTYTAGRPKEIAYIVSRLWQAWKEPAEHGNRPSTPTPQLISMLTRESPRSAMSRV